VALANIPAFLGHDGSAVVDYFELGKLALSNGDGTLPDLFLRKSQGLFYPIADSMTALSYDLVAGAQMAVTELLSPPALNTSLNPWDRSPAFVNLGGLYGVNGPTALTTAWTYTVPAGRILAVARARVSAVRNVVASTPVYVQGIIHINGGEAINLIAPGTAVGSSDFSDFAADAVYLPAGTTLNGQYASYDTGGSWLIEVSLSGTLFNA
jgi:hypothetical protein